ncbi:MAG: DNA gyrase subunit A, partial [Nanoarchaeota archaeon]
MTEETNQKLGTRIIPRIIQEEMKKSYLDYSMSVIVGRALPDVRDGLKPVHRRVLYTMWDIGLTHDKPFKKSANVVGNCMAKFHPHSDAAIYDTIVRLAQDFSMRYPLVDGQGNFGCFTADTRVKLADGRDLTFVELVNEHKQGKRNFTFTIDENGLIKIAEIKNPRMTKKNAEIMKVILDNGEEIRCTLNHKFMLKDGSYKEAKGLMPDDSLMPTYFRFSTKADDPNMIGYHMILQPKLNHKVLRIEFLDQFEDVYDLTIDNTHNFALSAGIFVHNSIDGDPAAAMRYSECRLTKLAEEMLEDIDKRTVRLIPNFDNSTTEPTVLPSKLPNLLVNGSSGIAVGMATNIPPHNVGEIIDAAIKQIGNPDLSIEEIMSIIQGPDFPTGAFICGRNGIKEAYSTGRGKILVRAKTSIEQSKNKSVIIVNEIPFMV